MRKQMKVSWPCLWKIGLRWISKVLLILGLLLASVPWLLSLGVPDIINLLHSPPHLTENCLPCNLCQKTGLIFSSSNNSVCNVMRWTAVEVRDMGNRLISLLWPRIGWRICANSKHSYTKALSALAALKQLFSIWCFILWINLPQLQRCEQVLEEYLAERLKTQRWWYLTDISHLACQECTILICSWTSGRWWSSRVFLRVVIIISHLWPANPSWPMYKGPWLPNSLRSNVRHLPGMSGVREPKAMLPMPLFPILHSRRSRNTLPLIIPR